MRILITDRHTQGDEHVEQDAAGADMELEFYDSPDLVPDEAWARADGVVTYRGAPVVMANLAKMQRARGAPAAGVGSAALIRHRSVSSL